METTEARKTYELQRKQILESELDNLIQIETAFFTMQRFSFHSWLSKNQRRCFPRSTSSYLKQQHQEKQSFLTEQNRIRSVIMAQIGDSVITLDRLSIGALISKQMITKLHVVPTQGPLPSFIVDKYGRGLNIKWNYYYLIIECHQGIIARKQDYKPKIVYVDEKNFVFVDENGTIVKIDYSVYPKVAVDNLLPGTNFISVVDDKIKQHSTNRDNNIPSLSTIITLKVDDKLYIRNRISNKIVVITNFIGKLSNKSYRFDLGMFQLINNHRLIYSVPMSLLF